MAAVRPEDDISIGDKVSLARCNDSSQGDSSRLVPYRYSSADIVKRLSFPLTPYGTLLASSVRIFKFQLMNNVASELGDFLLDRLNEISPSSRLCIGISGAPGAGKTTLSALIACHINDKFKSSNISSDNAKDVGIVVPLDGWHLPRHILDTFPDPKLAHDRRGSHWTFDGEAYVLFVEQLRKPISAEGVVTAPSFSHSLKDPVFDDVVVRPHHRIVIIEGLYVFLGTDPWIKAANIFDERWFVTADAKQGKQRLCRRHVQTGVAADWDEAVWRADNNDIPNGKFMETNMLAPTRRILNVEDSSLLQIV